MKTLHDKIVDIQSRLKVPKAQTNNFGKYKFRSNEDILKAVKPLLKEHNLVLTQHDKMIECGGRVYVKATSSISDADNTTCANTAFARESENKKGMDDSQITGTASSYARKYSLNGLFLLDDTKDADTDEHHNDAEKKAKQHKDAWSRHIAETFKRCEDEAEVADIFNKLNAMEGASSYPQIIKDTANATMARLNKEK